MLPWENLIAIVAVPTMPVTSGDAIISRIIFVDTLIGIALEVLVANTG